MKLVNACCVCEERFASQQEGACAITARTIEAIAFRSKTRRLNLALQGGGAHGAFTWGVLERVLREESLGIGWISGTSAGAVNAVAVAHGLAQGSRQAAIEALENIWTAVDRAQVPDLMRLNPVLAGLYRATPVPNVTSSLSPYEFNPMGFDPLRKILVENIDFEAISRQPGCDLIIAATDVETGRARLFRTHEITADVVIASACLPTLHHAVMIDGRAYWDGGFSANPDLITLAGESPSRDTLLVQLNPIRATRIPRVPRAISDRTDTIAFNQPLLRDIEEIIRIQSASSGWLNGAGGQIGRIQAHRFHLIVAGRHTDQLGADSKVKPDRGVLRYLFEAGRGEAQRWIEQCGALVGKRSSVDLAATYLRDLTQPADVVPQQKSA
ncbi:MAG: patatin-like phospholipase family protein [Pseudomonadota bacterium]